MNKKLTVVTSAYRSERYLEAYFNNMLMLEGLEWIKIIVVINDPTEKEKEISCIYTAKHGETFEIVFTPRESIGASTNRGYKMADTEYVAYADVDDLRPPDAYKKQLQTLLDHPEADFTYGDFIAVEKFGDTSGALINTKEFDVKEFTRSSMVGPNHFFRRALLDKVGYWDEQLKSGGDFDFQIRAAYNCQFKKTKGILAYYLLGENTNSASKNMNNPIEQTVIGIRYGIYDKIDYRLLGHTNKYDISRIYIGNDRVAVEKFVPRYFEVLESLRKEKMLKGLWRSCFRVFVKESRLWHFLKKATGRKKYL